MDWTSNTLFIPVVIGRVCFWSKERCKEYTGVFTTERGDHIFLLRFGSALLKIGLSKEWKENVHPELY